MISDFRHAARRLLQTPASSLPAVLVLAVGVSANGAVISLAEALLRKPLPVANPAELVAVYSQEIARGQYGSLSFPEFEGYRRRNHVFEDLMAYSDVELTLRGGERTEKVDAQIISESYFSVLGIQPHHGRWLTPERAGSGAVMEAVLSFDLWRSRFGADPDLVGDVVYLNRHAFTVVGIAAEGFHGTDPEIRAEIWIPMRAYAVTRPGLEERFTYRGTQWLICVGRLRQGLDLEDARREMRALQAQQAQDYPEFYSESRLYLLRAEHGTVDPRGREEAARLLGLFGAATGLLLAVVCASTTSLLLLRTMARAHDIAVRRALGAPRRNLLRGFLSEHLLVALLGGGLGLLGARGLLSLLSRFQPSEFLPVAQGITFHLSPAVGVMILLLSLFAVLVSGVVPSFYMLTVDLRSELGSRTAVGTPKATRRRLWSLFVVAEVALSAVLLTATGLTLESWRRLSSIDLGIDSRNVTLAVLDLRSGHDEETGGELFHKLHEQLDTLPGVESVGLAATVPLGGRSFKRQLLVDGFEPGPEGWTHSLTGNVVSPGYFRTLGLPLLRGRDFDRRDLPEAPGVVIVNEALARTFWPGEEALGKSFRFILRGEARPVRIVGVVRNSWHLRDRRSQHGPHFYLPLSQRYQSKMTLFVKAALSPGEVERLTGEEVRRLDEDLAIFDVSSLTAQLDASLAREKTAVGLLGATGLVALLLAGFGLYSTLTYLVARRTAEIGLRMALGALPRDIQRNVVGRGIGLTGLGLLLGLSAAAWSSHLLYDLLYEVTVVEPVVYSAVAVLALGLAVLASYLPARRAARVDPLTSLRRES